jgi:hypothetical protein
MKRLNLVTIFFSYEPMEPAKEFRSNLEFSEGYEVVLGINLFLNKFIISMPKITNY